jgi:hypothetical protein
MRKSNHAAMADRELNVNLGAYQVPRVTVEIALCRQANQSPSIGGQWRPHPQPHSNAMAILYVTITALMSHKFMAQLVSMLNASSDVRRAREGEKSWCVRQWRI